jgi:hypothetical protein
MVNPEEFLSGSDLRSIANSNQLVLSIRTQRDFDKLFRLLFSSNRLIVMRAADAIEKITINHRGFLNKHLNEVFQLCAKVENKELKWHLALLLPRFPLNGEDALDAWRIASNWALDKTNSRIVRVNAIQTLFELTKQNSRLGKDLNGILSELGTENIPSVAARIRKIKKFIS